MEIARPQANASAGANSVSLYQQCMVLIEKLYSLPDFEYYLFPQGVDALIDNPSLLDPVAVIWACFRLGAPFCQLYNQLRPRKRLQVPDLPSVAPPYNNSCKKAVYEFIVACKAELQMEESELFSISGLYKDDTNEFVKLMKTVSIVVKKVEDANLFPPPRPLPFSTPTIDPTAPSDNRAKLIAELLNTERVYTADLEKLQRYKRELNSQNIVPRDTLLHLFANLDELLDFQRRFLLQMEATLSLPIQEQRIGQLFMQNEEAFSVYVPFCGNYQFSTQTAMENAVQLQRVTTMDPLRELPSYLIRPVQRACKYPLLLNELIKYSDESTYPFMNELQEGLAAIKRVTDLVNEQKRQEENRRVKQDVIDRVEDWKGLNIGEFGDLLLSDKFPMSTGEAERDYELYLFERILLCCKDTTKKRKSKKGVKDDTTTYSLKGNIYIERIDSVANESNPVTQKFQLKVFWRDGMDMESFVLRCRNVEQMKLWNGRLDTLIQTERMRKISLRESNPYSKSTQLHPDIVRGLQPSKGSGDGQYGDDRGRTAAPPLLRHDTFYVEAAAEDDWRESRQTRGSKPYSSSVKYVQEPVRGKSPYRVDPSFDPRYANQPDGSPPTARKSAPAKPRNVISPATEPTDYRQQYQRARSTSPGSHRGSSRNASPPPPVPQIPQSPPIPNIYSGMPAAAADRFDQRQERQRQQYDQSREQQRRARQPDRDRDRDRSRGNAYDQSFDDSSYDQSSFNTSYSSSQRFRGDDLPPSPPISIPNSPMPDRRSQKSTDRPAMAPRNQTTPYMSPGDQYHSAPVLSPPPTRPPLSSSMSVPGGIGGIQRVTVDAQGYYRPENIGRNPSGNSSSSTRSNTSAANSSFSSQPPQPQAYGRSTNGSSASSKFSASSISTTPIPTNSANPKIPMTPSTPAPGSLKVKMHYGTDIFLIAVPPRCSFHELAARMERKIRLCGQAVPEGKSLRMRYKDEDGDYVVLGGDADVAMAFEGAAARGSAVNVWILWN